jgi:hypothetical protein
VIRGNPFKPADCHRFFVGASTPAGGLTRAIADPAENAGENVALAVLNIGVGKLTLGNLADVLRHICVRWTGPLAIDNLVEVIWIIRIGGLHL